MSTVSFPHASCSKCDDLGFEHYVLGECGLVLQNLSEQIVQEGFATHGIFTVRWF